MSFPAQAIAGVIISTVTAMSVTALCVTSNPLPNISYKTSWIGNTFGGGSKWVQIQISAMYVASDGTVYTNSVWDEAGREAGIYKDGDAIAKASLDLPIVPNHVNTVFWRGKIALVSTRH